MGKPRTANGNDEGAAVARARTMGSLSSPSVPSVIYRRTGVDGRKTPVPFTTGVPLTAGFTTTATGGRKSVRAGAAMLRSAGLVVQYRRRPVASVRKAPAHALEPRCVSVNGAMSAIRKPTCRLAFISGGFSACPTSVAMTAWEQFDTKRHYQH